MKIGEMFSGVLGTAFCICWGFGDVAGIITAIIEHSLINGVLSFFIPLYGAVYTLIHIFS